MQRQQQQSSVVHPYMLEVRTVVAHPKYRIFLIDPTDLKRKFCKLYRIWQTCESNRECISKRSSPTFAWVQLCREIKAANDTQIPQAGGDLSPSRAALRCFGH
jgi:hypothetical protein